MSSTAMNALARWRSGLKRKRERRLGDARRKVEFHRAYHPPAQGRLELDEPYVSKREHDLEYLRKVQLEQAREREARIAAAHAAVQP